MAASEDSNIYRYSLKNGTLDKIFKLHKGLVTAFIMDDNENVFSISVDGFMHKFNVDVCIFVISNSIKYICTNLFLLPVRILRILLSQLMFVNHYNQLNINGKLFL